MAGWQELWGRVVTFLRQDLWEADLAAFSPPRRRLWRLVQVAVLTGRDFYADRCLLRASALTYTTLLSLVPLLALMFSLLKGLGVQNMLEPIILSNIALGSERIVTEILRYIENTNVARLGVFGLVFLVITVLTLLSNIEEIFNYIWGVRETRPLLRRFADYSSVVVVAPIFVVAAVSMTTTLESQALVQWLLGLALVGEVVFFLFRVLPYLAMWAAFTFLFLYMPNARVHFRAALIGGVFGGTLWQLVQYGYVHFQIGVSKYNAIYGTMAALPVFMVWIYLSWLIVLLGLEVAFACQHLGSLQLQVRGEGINFASRELAALTVLLVVAEAFQRGTPRWTLARISQELGLPPRLAKMIVDELVQLGFISELQADLDGETPVQLARAPESVALFQVLEALREEGIKLKRLRPTPERQVVGELEDLLAEAERQALAGMTLRDLVERLAEKSKGDEKKEEG